MALKCECERHSLVALVWPSVAHGYNIAVSRIESESLRHDRMTLSQSQILIIYQSAALTPKYGLSSGLPIYPIL